jgi:hypothetical protein
MNEQLKGNLQLGLLVLIAATVIYGTFIKEDLPKRGGASQGTTITSADPNIPVMNPLDPSQQIQQPQQPQQPQRPSSPPTSVSFEKMAHDFGTIKQESEHDYVFKFTNTGSNPLIIESANGSCGCTVPDYPKEPIAPGATGEIKVNYKPGQQKGQQAKTVTIIANTEPRETRLNISAVVEEI